jgi:hypothetical protein
MVAARRDAGPPRRRPPAAASRRKPLRRARPAAAVSEARFTGVKVRARYPNPTIPPGPQRGARFWPGRPVTYRRKYFQSTESSRHMEPVPATSAPQPIKLRRLVVFTSLTTPWEPKPA